MSEARTEFQVTAFYLFAPLAAARVTELRAELEALCLGLDIRGLMLLAEEGINATVAGKPSAIADLKTGLLSIPELSALEFKDSYASFCPFKRFKLDLRCEIVTSGNPDLKPWEHAMRYLEPEEWNRTLNSGQDFVVLDTRNIYETAVGKFRCAVDPGIKAFGDFPDFLEVSGLPRDKKVLIYCTGGIRCEKAALQMERAGFTNVYQLRGGILKYLEQFPDSAFEGECFVFDHRCSLDQRLQPSTTYKLCPHCGDPGTLAISCVHCGKSARVCETCAARHERQSCSKNCAYHVSRRDLGPCAERKRQPSANP